MHLRKLIQCQIYLCMLLGCWATRKQQFLPVACFSSPSPSTWMFSRDPCLVFEMFEMVHKDVQPLLLNQTSSLKGFIQNSLSQTIVHFCFYLLRFYENLNYFQVTLFKKKRTNKEEKKIIVIQRFVDSHLNVIKIIMYWSKSQQQWKIGYYVALMIICVAINSMNVCIEIVVEKLDVTYFYYSRFLHIADEDVPLVDRLMILVGQTTMSFHLNSILSIVSWDFLTKRENICVYYVTYRLVW